MTKKKTESISLLKFHIKDLKMKQAFEACNLLDESI